MYLGMLDNDKKHLFLDLDIYISKIDGNFSESEKQIINAHCLEMRIDRNNYTPELSQDVLFKKIENELSFKESRIFFLELVATVLADNVYNSDEKNLINKLASILKITYNEIQEAFSIIETMKMVYNRCAAFILEN